MKSTVTFLFLLLSASMLQAQLPTYWDSFSSSSTALDEVNTASKPLQFNDELNTVSYVCRNSRTYLASPSPVPTASDAVVVAYINQPGWNGYNYSWDSTCLWSDNAHWARSPQGSIYNPPGNTTFTNAFVVGCGPASSTAGINGNWYASKSLWEFDPVVSPQSGNMQFFSGASTTGSMGPAAFSDVSFTSTDDGLVRSLAEYGFNPATQQSWNSGAMLITGVFNSSTNTFDWKSDSIICPAALTGAGKKSMCHSPRMAWNEAGTIGYIVFMGSRQGESGSNTGWQPIIYKTANSGATWNLLPAIDFNSSGASLLKSHLTAVNNSTVNNAPVIPFFKVDEGFDVIVDESGRLHIAGLVYSSLKSNTDSLDTHAAFLNTVDNELYSWPHTPGRRPYLYDFIGDGTTTWIYGIVDSLSTENPGTHPNQPGYNYNSWDINPTDSTKLPVPVRIQLSRTPDGRFIVFNWTESDTATTTGQVKWNIFPNVNVRVLDAHTYQLSPAKINLTDPPSNPNPAIRGYAFSYNVSPCANASVDVYGDPILNLPVIVSNNASLHQLEPCNHYYMAATLSTTNIIKAFTYTIGPAGTATNTTYTVTAIKHYEDNEAAISVYPNPAKDQLYVNVKSGQSINGVALQNTLGQTIYSNSILPTNSIDLHNLPQGIYLLHLKTSSIEKTVKIIHQE